jgi:hypothetical protein
LEDNPLVCRNLNLALRLLLQLAELKRKEQSQTLILEDFMTEEISLLESFIKEDSTKLLGKFLAIN